MQLIYKVEGVVNCHTNYIDIEQNLVSSPAPPSGWSERERRRVWEITQGGSVQRAEIPRQVLIMKVGLNYKVQNRSGGSLASQTR